MKSSTCNYTPQYKHDLHAEPKQKKDKYWDVKSNHDAVCLAEHTEDFI